MKKQLPVFVYGTLRKGFGNYRLLKGKTIKEECGLIDGAIYPVSSNGGFPCLVEQKGVVVGELMYIEPNMYEQVLERLDGLEGYREKDERYSMYLRRVRTVQTRGGNVEAYVYIWNNGIRTEKIPSGCWKTFEQQRAAARKRDDNFFNEWAAEYDTDGF
jgi:gamma-glutamylcyclotransferase (GGCT)/AIG2-like uncharacterized protein YtfP